MWNRANVVKVQLVSFSSIFCYLLFLIGCAGCCIDSSEVTIKVVDFETLQPIPYASTIIDFEQMAYDGYVDVSKRGGSCAIDGTYTLKGLRDCGLWRTSVEFYSLGYYDSGLQLQNGKASVFRRALGDGSKSELLCRNVDKDISGVYLVKLVQNKTKDPDTRLHGWTDDPHDDLQPRK